MKQLLSILLIAIGAGIATFFFPWWMIAVVSFLVVIVIKPTKAFGAGFFGIMLLWLVMILYKDSSNQHILSIRMTKLFSLPHYSLFVLVNILIGGLVGGLAGWSGQAMNNFFRKK